MIFLPSPSWQGQLGFVLRILLWGYLAIYPMSTLFTLYYLCIFLWEWLSRWGWGRGRTCKSTGASLASKAGMFARTGCAAKEQMSPALPHRSGLGAAKSPLLTDVPRCKMKSFNQVMLQERPLSIWWVLVRSPAVFRWYQIKAPHHQNCSRKKQFCS